MVANERARAHRFVANEIVISAGASGESGAPCESRQLRARAPSESGGAERERAVAPGESGGGLQVRAGSHVRAGARSK